MGLYGASGNRVQFYKGFVGKEKKENNLARLGRQHIGTHLARSVHPPFLQSFQRTHLTPGYHMGQLGKQRSIKAKATGLHPNLPIYTTRKEENRYRTHLSLQMERVRLVSMEAKERTAKNYHPASAARHQQPSPSTV